MKKNEQVQEWINILTDGEPTKEELTKIREQVDVIANKLDQSDLEVTFLTAWFLLEMRVVENDVEKIDLSWATGK